MKNFLILNSVAATLFVASGLVASDASAGICPSVGGEADCGQVITVAPGGTFTSVSTNGANYGLGTIDSNPYDTVDDALVGVINNSGETLSVLHMTGTGSGGGIFAFDGDGQQGFSGGVAFVPPAPYTHTGYEGPNIAFTNISADGTSGDIVFIGGLAAGATRWFSLEGAPNTLVTAVPEPETYAMLLSGLGLIGFLTRRRAAA
jgi:hypothetical protein